MLFLPSVLLILPMFILHVFYSIVLCLLLVLFFLLVFHSGIISSGIPFRALPKAGVVLCTNLIPSLVSVLFISIIATPDVVLDAGFVLDPKSSLTALCS